MSGMKADEEDFETASEAKETIEKRYKNTRDDRMIIVNTANTITTATLVSEVPCCSQCRKQFPVNEWIAVCRCPIAEAHAERECNAKLLHRHCVQAHYVICHPQEECPQEFTQPEAQQTQRMFQEVRQLACRQCSQAYMSLNRKCRNCRRPLCTMGEPDPLLCCNICAAASSS